MKSAGEMGFSKISLHHRSLINLAKVKAAIPSNKKAKTVRMALNNLGVNAVRSLGAYLATPRYQIRLPVPQEAEKTKGPVPC